MRKYMFLELVGLVWCVLLRWQQKIKFEDTTKQYTKLDSCTYAITLNTLEVKVRITMLYYVTYHNADNISH